MVLKSESDPLLLEANKIDAEKGGSLPKKIPGGWRCMPFILGNEAFEKLASFGLTANLTVYLVERYGMKQVSAAMVGIIFGGTTNFMPLLGAFVADAYLGRYWTLALGSIVSFLGMVSWTLASLVPQLQSPKCTEMDLQSAQCTGPTKWQLAYLYFSMGLLVLGAGGVRPCTLPFGVDQFDFTTEQGKRSLKSLFNWYYCTITAALLFSMTVIVYIQDSVNWSLGFGIPTIMMLLSVILFFMGSRLYVNVPPEGSIFSSITRVFVASFRKRKLKLPSLDEMEQQNLSIYDPPLSNNHTIKLPLSQQFRFLNKAAIICEGELSPDVSVANKWRLCSIHQIEEAKCFMRVMPIWASGIICLLAITQQWSFLILQSLKMDRHLGPNFQIPAGSMASVGMIGLIVFIPTYDRIIVPVVRSITKIDGGITILQRQGVGMVFCILSMVLAGLVEKIRRDSALSNHNTSPMSVLWLVPQLLLIGIGESFNAVGQVEFYNRQLPENMKSMAGSLFCFSQAGASYITSFLITIIQKTTGGDGRKNWLDNDINHGQLDYYYYLIAALGAVNMFYFLWCASSYRYKDM